MMTWKFEACKFACHEEFLNNIVQLVFYQKILKIRVVFLTCRHWMINVINNTSLT